MYTTKQIEDVTKQPEGTMFLKGELDGHSWSINHVSMSRRHAQVHLDGKCIASRCRWDEACRLVTRKLNETK